MADPLEPIPLIQGAQSAESLTGSLLRPIERKAGRVWWALFLLTLGGTGLFGLAIAVTLVKGIGAWGNNIPVAWAFGIIDFVWWIGFGHAGTLISAILLTLAGKGLGVLAPLVLGGRSGGKAPSAGPSWIGGEGVLIELVQAPPEVISAFDSFAKASAAHEP